MHRPLLIVTLLALAGCASVEPQQVASRECKVHPVQAATVAPGKRPESSLEQQQAVAQLGTSDLRRQWLARPMGATGTLEEALRDCY